MPDRNDAARLVPSADLAAMIREIASDPELKRTDHWQLRAVRERVLRIEAANRRLEEATAELKGAERLRRWELEDRIGFERDVLHADIVYLVRTARVHEEELRGGDPMPGRHPLPQDVKTILYPFLAPAEERDNG